MKEIFNEIQELNKVHKTTIKKGLCKLFEEVGELAQSSNKLIGLKRHNQTLKEIQEEIAEESADTIQNIFSLCDAAGVSYEEVFDMLQKKNKKWEQKIKIKLDEQRNENKDGHSSKKRPKLQKRKVHVSIWSRFLGFCKKALK